MQKSEPQLCPHSIKQNTVSSPLCALRKFVHVLEFLSHTNDGFHSMREYNFSIAEMIRQPYIKKKQQEPLAFPWSQVTPFQVYSSDCPPYSSQHALGLSPHGSSLFAVHFLKKV